MLIPSNVPTAKCDSPVPKRKVVSLFSGCGGSSLGYHMAACEVVYAVEWDQNAVDCYRVNFPHTYLFHGDIHKVGANDIFQMTGLKVGELDILDGSPPCQGFSTSGARRFEDNRNFLFNEYARLLMELKPKAMVMENVSGLVKGKMKIIFAEMLRKLKNCGYNIRVELLDAQYYGVPQSRERTIFIGFREDLNIIPQHPRPYTTPMGAALAVEGITEKGPIITRSKVLEYWKATPPGKRFADVHPQGSFWDSRKLHPFLPSPTIRKTSGGFYHWNEPRVLSIGELKRLHSFPDDFKLIGSFQEQWARIGNSVPPLLMKSIAEQVCKQLNEAKI